MNPKSPTTLIFLLEALKGLEESKEHLKNAACEVLLAARSVSSTVSNLADESGLTQNYPYLMKGLHWGEKLVGEILSRAQQEARASEDVSRAAEHPVVTRLPAKETRVSKRAKD